MTAIIAPCGSTTIPMRPTVGMSVPSMQTFAPSRFALASVASTSATCTYGTYCAGIFGSGERSTPARPLSPAVFSTW